MSTRFGEAMRTKGRGPWDPRNRDRSLRHRPDRASARAIRRAFRRKNPGGVGARALSPVMLDLSGPKLTVAENELLHHPLAGGVILFARNFESTRQLAALTGEIRALREPELLIAVDHEGGRVQRFQEGFTRIPPMRTLGEGWEKNPSQARALAEAAGYVIAAELRSHGVG